MDRTVLNNIIRGKKMKAPQLILADDLAKDWNETEVETKELSREKTSGRYWVLARPYAIGGVRKRLRLAWYVFIGRYDAIRWIEQ